MTEPGAVALLHEGPEPSTHLRDALERAGVPVVYEGDVHDCQLDAIAASGATVVVINLGDSDAGMDAVEPLLGDPRFQVVFDEGAVSGRLEGWDQARWARHLAAKIAGRADASPPRPAGAEAVPVPPQPETGPEPEPLATEAVGPGIAAAPAHEPQLAPEPDHPSAVPDPLHADVTAEADDLLDLDALFSDPPTESVADAGTAAAPPAAAGEPTGLVDLADLGTLSLEPLVEELDALPADEPGAGPRLVPASLAVDWELDGPAPPATDAPEPEPASAADFGIETVSAAEFLAPDAAPATEDDGFGSLSLELVPLEEVISPAVADNAHAGGEHWLAADVEARRIRRVWVLAASIGGPEAVRAFMSRLPRGYPALFLLAQHLGDEFVPMMVQQLEQVCAMPVRVPGHGDRASHGEVLVVPAGQRLRVDAQGVVTLEALAGDGGFPHGLDTLLRDAADRFGADAGTIIFSGMGDDAVEGSRYLAGKGGTVLGQRPDTCVISTMVDAVQATGVMQSLGSPDELAEQLLAEAETS